MTREQLIEFCAVALYDGWREEENQRRREMRALRPRGLPMDLPEWGGIPQSQRETFFARARPMALALEREGMLNVGTERLYDVEVDDPDLAKKYAWYGIPAFSARAAAWEGARRTVRADPLAFLYSPAEGRMEFPDGVMFPPPNADGITLENPVLIEAVAMYARVRRASPGGRDPWVEGDALWLGYQR